MNPACSIITALALLTSSALAGSSPLVRTAGEAVTKRFAREGSEEMTELSMKTQLDHQIKSALIRSSPRHRVRNSVQPASAARLRPRVEIVTTPPPRKETAVSKLLRRSWWRETLAGGTAAGIFKLFANIGDAIRCVGTLLCLGVGTLATFLLLHFWRTIRRNRLLQSCVNRSTPPASGLNSQDNIVRKHFRKQG